MTKCKCLNDGEVIIDRDCPVHGETAMPEKWRKDTPTDSQAELTPMKLDEFLQKFLREMALEATDGNTVIKSLDYAIDEHLFGWAVALHDKIARHTDNAIQAKLAEADKAAYDAGYDTRSLEADHEIAEAEKAARLAEIENFEALDHIGTLERLNRVVLYLDRRKAELQHRQTLNKRSE